MSVLFRLSIAVAVSPRRSLSSDHQIKVFFRYLPIRSLSVCFPRMYKNFCNAFYLFVKQITGKRRKFLVIFTFHHLYFFLLIKSWLQRFSSIMGFRILYSNFADNYDRIIKFSSLIASLTIYLCLRFSSNPDRNSV